MTTIIESEMCFGDYTEEKLFQIEHSDLHKSLGAGIKSVEFILLRGKETIIFVEAKKSCPNGSNRLISEEKQEKFENYYTDIVDKFIDSLQMFLTTVLGRSGSNAIGRDIKDKADYSKTSFLFVLVIKTAIDEAWLVGPQHELEERLKSFRKIWGIKIIVLNFDLAVQHGIVKAELTE